MHFFFFFGFSEFFVVDFHNDDISAAQPREDSDATVSVLSPELDKSAYHEQTVTLLEETAAHTPIEEKLAAVYVKGDPIRRELDMGQKQKVIATVEKIKELIPKTCQVCGETVSTSHNMSGAVLAIQWNCSNGHSNSWISSEVLTVKNNQKVYVNNVQLSAAILLSGNNFAMFELLAKFLGLSSISETLFYRIQKLYCCPAVQNMWNQVKEVVHV